MFDNDDKVRVEYIDGHQWRLLEDFSWFEADLANGEGVMIDVPAGFVTDFASIPRIFWNIAPPSYYAKPAILHDWLYYNGAVGDLVVTRAQADKTFRDALKETGVNGTRRWIMWSAVRTFGGRAWNVYRDNDAHRKQIDALTKGTAP
jgi:hypothetical protein